MTLRALDMLMTSTSLHTCPSNPGYLRRNSWSRRLLASSSGLLGGNKVSHDAPNAKPGHGNEQTPYGAPLMKPGCPSGRGKTQMLGNSKSLPTSLTAPLRVVMTPGGSGSRSRYQLSPHKKGLQVPCAVHGSYALGLVGSPNRHILCLWNRRSVSHSWRWAYGEVAVAAAAAQSLLLVHLKVQRSEW